MDDATFGKILDIFATFPVLVFRDQDMGIEQQQTFAERFGVLQSRARPAHERGANASTNPNVMLVTNVRDASGKPLGNQQSAYEFHSDGCFNDLPALATLLYGNLPKNRQNRQFSGRPVRMRLRPQPASFC